MDNCDLCKVKNYSELFPVFDCFYGIYCVATSEPEKTPVTLTLIKPVISIIGINVLSNFLFYFFFSVSF